METFGINTLTSASYKLCMQNIDSLEQNKFELQSVKNNGNALE